MKNNTTHLRLKTGRPKRVGSDNGRRSFSPNISSNYKMMLQIYYLNKEAMAKKELKHQRLGIRKSAKTRIRPALLMTGVISFFEESLVLLRKLKPKFAMATVSE